MRPLHSFLLALALLLGAAPAARAESGHDLWLRYKPVDAAHRAAYRAGNMVVAMDWQSPTLNAARDELVRGLTGLLGRPQRAVDVWPGDREIGPRPVGTPWPVTSVENGGVLIGTPQRSFQIRQWHFDLSAAGDEGYVIRSGRDHGRSVTIIAANSDIGVLYGVFAYLRLMQTNQPLTDLNIVSAPKTKLRMLDHWDNLNRTSERGYAGLSLWNWSKLPQLDQVYTDYARANASIGINGAVLNNVNADLRIYSPDYLRKVAALASAFRPYGIKVYLSMLSSAPIQIGGLKTADPRDPGVAQWWKEEADTIYRAIPDFGGFLVKANSEGQPGPQDYGRTQAEGANVMAQALARHGGVVIWRAFVYSPDNREERAKHA
jgi:alpha-glucuronidase